MNSIFSKLKNAKSKSTFYRYKKTFQSEKDKDNDRESDSSSDSDNLMEICDLNESSNLNVDENINNLNESSNLNLNPDINDLNESSNSIFDQDISHLNESISSISSAGSLNSVIDSSDKLISQLILEHKLKFYNSKTETSGLLELINNIAKIKNIPDIVPTTFYNLTKSLNKNFDLDQFIGFKCHKKNCNNLIYLNVTSSLVCNACNKSHKLKTVNNGANFRSLSLIQELNIILNEKPIVNEISSNEHSISSIFDGDIYKDYLNLKEDRIIIISLYSDGVKISKSKRSSKKIWPIFFKIHDLDCPESEKVFLLSSFYGEPDPNFYLENIINELNSLFKDGIFIRSLGITVYPLLILSLFDYPAKCLFLNHKSHTGYFGCTTCDIKGEYLHHRMLFKLNPNTNLRDFKELEQILLTKSLPYKGVKGKNAFINLEYFDFYSCTPVDPMHSDVGGVGKRLIECMLSAEYKSMFDFNKSKFLIFNFNFLFIFFK